MKIIRYLVYEGSKDWLKRTLSKSLSPGETDLGRGKITVIQFPELKVPNEGRYNEELLREIDTMYDDPL
jgi:hypothetical protein